MVGLIKLLLCIRVVQGLASNTSIELIMPSSIDVVTKTGRIIYTHLMNLSRDDEIGGTYARPPSAPPSLDSSPSFPGSPIKGSPLPMLPCMSP